MSDTLIPANGLIENSPTLFWAVAAIMLSIKATDRIAILFIDRQVITNTFLFYENYKTDYLVCDEWNKLCHLFG
jgi:hypothetical protein